MGQRFRLKPGFPLFAFSATDRVIPTALETAATFPADNGPPWFLSCVQDER